MPPDKLPRNVTVLPLRNQYRQLTDHVRFDAAHRFDGASLAGAEGEVLLLLDMAATVAGHDFDVLEIPDFQPFAAILPHALREMGSGIGRVVVSMHGTLTHALAENWAPETAFDLPRLAHFEQVLFRTADLRYGIGRPYLREWEQRTGFAGHLLDVGTVMDFAGLARARQTRRSIWTDDVKPDLVYVGRHEKCKGPDLFVDFVGSLPPSCFGRAMLIGPPVELQGYGSLPALKLMASRRGIDLHFDTMPRPALMHAYTSEPWYVLLPSRKDTFNLAALEAVLSGCPTAVSSATGASDYLREALPGLPCLHVNPDELGASRAAIMEQLADFGGARRALDTFLADAAPRPFGTSIKEIWGRTPQFDAALNDQLVDFTVDLLADLDRKLVGSTIRGTAQTHFAQQIDATLQNSSPALAALLKQLPAQVERLDELRRELADDTGGHMAISDARLTAMSDDLAPMVFSANRAGLYDMLAQVERCRGNELLFATYKLRAMRLSDHAAHDVAEVQAVLTATGYPEEAQVAGWLHASEPDVASARQYLDEALTRFMRPPAGDIEAMDDRRSSSQPRASIIVSLYRAAEKLPAFLRGLSRLSAQSRACCEIVLIDSHSLDDTRDVVARQLAALAAQGTPLDVLYVRTSVRETIQRAWNRGIAAARGEYIAFLGVDEMNRSDAFDILIDYLDRHRDVDWVQGTAVVTDVDWNGGFVRDVMAYDRRFDLDVVQLLDTCFLGYVGALYRRNLHNRVGYYDDRFRGAGDTEFKNRALPHMRAVTLPVCLGFFLNYPEERVTASPGVEIEDLRAWYLHRSPAGIGFQFDGSNLDRAFNLATKCLNYRKTYLIQDSTDLELGANVNRYLRQKAPSRSMNINNAITCVDNALACYRALDGLDMLVGKCSVLDRAERVQRITLGMARRLRVETDIMRGDGWQGSFSFVNDNRSHQHFNLWPSTLGIVAAAARVDGPELGDAGVLVSPLLTFDILVNAKTVVDGGLQCQVDGRLLTPGSEQGGQIAFTRPGRRMQRGSWRPKISFFDRNGVEFDVAGELVIDLRGLTDRMTGDRALSLEGFHYVERDQDEIPTLRWTGSGPMPRIGLPVASQNGGRVELTFANLGVNRLQSIGAVLNGTELRPQIGVDPDTVILPLPSDLALTGSRALDVVLTSLRTNVFPGDDRSLGVAIARVRVVFPLRQGSAAGVSAPAAPVSVADPVVPRGRKTGRRKSS